MEVHAEVPAADPAEVPAEVHVDRSGGLEARHLIQRERTQHLKVTLADRRQVVGAYPLDKTVRL